LFGIDCAGESVEPPLDAVLDRAMALGALPCKRILLYAPDAIGLHFCEAHPEIIAPVAREASTAVALRAAIPPVTPVCFGSMFTGYPPSVHGITKLERPVLRCETLFDRLVQAGKKVAIVATRGSSIDRIFRERPLDYFSEDYDPQATERALQLIAARDHDLILVYHQEYDDALHRTTPGSESALEAARRHVASFVQLAQAVNRSWSAGSRMIAFAPDHGAHVNPESGRGTHGIEVPEDMDMRHFFGVFRAVG
jgi:hypothetical protein